MRYPWLAALGLFACGSDNDLAGGVLVTDLTLYQGPEIKLIKNLEVVTSRDVPVIADRAGRFHVRLQMPYGAEAREVTVRIAVSDALTGETTSVERGVALTGGMLVAETDIEFERALLPSSNLIYAVSVHEQPGFQPQNAEIFDGARLPETGGYPLDARPGRTFRVVLLPTGPNPPVIGNGRVDRWRATLASWLPVTDVEISVAAPLPIDRDLSQNSGWDILLGDVADWRAAEGLDSDVFAIGVVETSQTSPLLGIAATLAIENPYWRVVTLQLQPDDEQENTLVAHELGHALGRSHVACGDPGGPDFAYPYQAGLIGVPGLDLRDRVLRMPDEYVDFMSYCSPAFVSDYGFTQLYRGFLSLEDRAALPVGDPELIRDPVRPAERTP